MTNKISIVSYAFFYFRLFTQIWEDFSVQINKKRTFFVQLANKSKNMLCVFFWIFIIYGFDIPYIATLTLASAAAHELGHVVALRFTGRSAPLGARACGLKIRSGGCSYRERIFVCLAGPATNVFIAFFALPFAKQSGYAATVAVLNLLTAVSNLVPIRGTDGYNAIKALILNRFSDGCGEAVLDTISFVLTVLAAFASFYLVMRIGSGYWACGILLISLAKELECSKKRFFRDFARKNEIS